MELIQDYSLGSYCKNANVCIYRLILSKNCIIPQKFFTSSKIKSINTTASAVQTILYNLDIGGTSKPFPIRLQIARFIV